MATGASESSNAQPPPAWLDALRSAGLDLDAPALEHLGAALTKKRTVAKGETLFREGDRADCLFLVLEGKLEVSLDTRDGLVIQVLGAGAIVGEIGLLVGGDRSETLTALEDTIVVALTRDRYDALATPHPEITDALSSALRVHMRRAKVAAHLRDLLGEVDVTVRDAIERRVRWVHLAGGKELFRQGDPPAGAYIVAIGRLRVAIVDEAGRERIIDEVGPGEWMGEMALLTGAPRSATVYAVRDTELMWLSQEVFDEFVCSHPKALLQTSRAIVARLQRQMTAAETRPETRTIAIVPIRRDANIGWFTEQLARALSSAGSVVRLSAERVDGRLGKTGIAQSKPDDAGHLRLSEWLISQERAFDFVIYEADTEWSEWTDRTRRHADHVFFVADGSSSPLVGDIERPFTAQTALARRPRQSLVLLQPPGHFAYAGTAAWLEDRQVDGHFHVRRGNVADVARLSRILTNRAVCLVLGGGGSRGYAHIGVIRALEDLGIPVDAVGGTSVGAVVSCAKGFEMSSAEMLRIVPPLLSTAFFDPTLPIVSLMSGARNLKNCVDVAGQTQLEDFVVPVFCVSTNLTRGGTEVIHRRGAVALAMRTSGSVPGIFPPVRSVDGDLLVDGGLSNNVPVDVMANLYGGKIIAVDVIPEVDLLADADLPMAVSGWKYVSTRLNPFRRPLGMPNILSILMRSATTSSQGLRRGAELSRQCALYLRPSVSRWNMLDFGAADPIADEGYRATHDLIEAWWKTEKHVVLGTDGVPK